MIDGVECCNTNYLYLIDNKRVIVGGLNTFLIVNICKFSIEKKIVDKSLRYLNCFLKSRDNNTILCGYSILFCFYNMNTAQYKTVKSSHKSATLEIFQIDDKTFLSCSFDSSIKVWNKKS